jgi:hypothetical protein
MPQTEPRSRDDIFTLIAISTLARILGDILHEGVGHGLTAYLSGAHKLTLSTVALQSDNDTRLMAAAGTIVNLVAAAIFWLLLRNAARFAPATRYFLVTAMAGNLFSGTGYFFFSGVTNFGDWARVIQGLQPHWLWQIGLVVLGVAAYYASMVIVAAEFKPFLCAADRSRLRKLCWTPYFTDGLLALLAGLPNPAGPFYILASALPSSLGANTGLFVLPFMMHGAKPTAQPVPQVTRSRTWLACGAVGSILFIVVLGRGITWSR